MTSWVGPIYIQGPGGFEHECHIDLIENGMVPTVICSGPHAGTETEMRVEYVLEQARREARCAKK